jgi:hypothetical protein
MDKAATSFAVSLLFILRCLVPLAIMLGISYILKRLGYIKESPSRPRNENNSDDGNNNNSSNGEGLLHGSA